jgi:hypothetical protein
VAAVVYVGDASVSTQHPKVKKMKKMLTKRRIIHMELCLITGFDTRTDFAATHLCRRADVSPERVDIKSAPWERGV